MSRSEKHAWWIDRYGFGNEYTGECGCKYCTRTKAWLKRMHHKDQRRKGKTEILFDIAADEPSCPYIPECDCQP